MIHFLAQQELHVMLAINYLQRSQAGALSRVQSEETGLLVEVGVRHGLLPAQEGAAHLRVPVFATSQQL